MYISKIHRNLNYIIIGFLALILAWVVFVSVLAQTGAGKVVDKAVVGDQSALVVKPLPPALQGDFRAAQDEVAKLQAQLAAATLRGQNVLYRAALELGLSVRQAETCEVKQVSQGGAPAAWSFVCPPEPVQTPTPTPKAGK